MRTLLKFIIPLILLSSVFTFGQGSTTTPYDTTGWDPPEEYSTYYNLRIFTLLSNPGGGYNRNMREIDSLLWDLVVYTDTNQLIIRNDTLRLADHIAAAVDSNYSPFWIDFDPVHPDSVAFKEGRVFFDDVNQALAVYVEEPDVTLQTGQELWMRVFNDTGSLIENGTPCYPVGATAEGIGKVAPGQADEDVTSNILGIATHDIEDQTYGYLTRYGSLSGVATTGMALGATFYLSPTVLGGITTTRPDAPHNAVPLGGVTIVGGAGVGRVFAIIDRFDPNNGEAYISFADSSETITTALNTPAQITNGLDGLFIYNSDIGHDVTISGDTLYFAEDGVYEFDVSYSFEGAASAVFQFQMKVDGTFVPNVSARRKTSSADVGNTGFHAKVKIASTEAVTFWVTNIGNSVNIVMVDGNVSISQVR